MTVRQGIEQIVEEWGCEILKDSIIFQTLFSNLLSENIQEIKLFQQLDDTAMNLIYSFYFGSTKHRKSIFDELSSYLEKEIKLSKQEIDIIIKEFSAAFNCHNIIGDIDQENEEIECNDKTGDISWEKQAQLVKELITDTFPDVRVVVEKSVIQCAFYEIFTGMKIDRGFLSFDMYLDEDRLEKILKNPYILITNKKILHIQEIMPILHKVDSLGGDLLIIASDIEENVILTMKTKYADFSCVAIKAPSYGDRRTDILQDIAILTGGNVILDKDEQDLCEVSPGMLGRAEQVRIKSEDMIIIGGKGEISSLQSRLRHIKRKIRTTLSDFDREKLQERFANLSGEIVIISVGDSSMAEIQELAKNIEYAIEIYRVENIF